MFPLPVPGGRRVISAICLVIVLLLGSAGVARAEPAIRVRILQGVGSIRVASESLRVADRVLREPAAVATAEPGRVRVAGIESRSAVRVAGRGSVMVDGRRFPGELELLPRDDGRLDVVNVVPIESYVAGSVAGEIYPDWPDEVLKAQAVIARTYGMYERSRHAGEPFHVESSVISQRYVSGALPGRVERAVRSTRGAYLAFHGQPLLAVYHSSAGGRTASAREVWGEDLPYLTPVSSPDDDAPDHFWSFEIPAADFAEALRERGVQVARAAPVEVSERSDSGRVLRLRVGESELSGRDLRQVLGGAAIKSTLFDVREHDGTVRFLGSGSGHGVGLSQWGALALAREGSSWQEILAHYYPGSEIMRASGEE